MLEDTTVMRHLIVFLVTLTFGLLMVPLVADAQPAETLREQLLGTWQLVSHPYFTDAVGRLLYAADGQMCVTLMRPDRQKFSTASPFGGSTAEERAAAAAGYFNYCGSYHVNEEKGIVTERIDLSLFPNWVGTEQMTFISVSGNQLTQRGGAHATVWERLR
jgi:hypothetical protein